LNYNKEFNATLDKTAGIINNNKIEPNNLFRKCDNDVINNDKYKPKSLFDNHNKSQGTISTSDKGNLLNLILFRLNNDSCN